ncbi:hypothetical protein [Trichothermofontia sp.]
MDYIDTLIEKLKAWARRLLEALLGPQEPESEAVPIPIPVDDCRLR